MKLDQSDDQPVIALAQRLVYRLEHLSVDSHWAVHASGVRRSLLRALDDLAAGDESALQRLEMLLKMGFELVEQAAKEMGDRK